MRMSGAEKAGLFGGVLLAAAVVASAVILLRPEPSPILPADLDVAAATGTAAISTPEVDVVDRPGEPDPAGMRETPEGEADLHRELSRLRKIIEANGAEIDRLRSLLRKAEIAFEEKEKQPEVVARETIEELQRCGPETDATQIEDLVQRLVEAGAPAVTEIQGYLDNGMDVKFTDTWTVLSGRLLGYPGLRLALIDALAQIGGISGDSALITVLRGNEAPLEICLLIAYLERVRNVPAVQEARRDAAMRYLDLEPHRQERQVIIPLLGVLAELQPPEEAANALLRFIRTDERNPAQTVGAIHLLDELPEATAIAALTALAVDRNIGKKAEEAAEMLIMRDGAALSSIPDVLAKGHSRVRSVIYRYLTRPVQANLQEAKSRSVRSGLEAITLLDDLDRSIAARRAIADEWREKERETNLTNQLLSARSRLNKLTEESAALRKRLTVE